MVSYVYDANGNLSAKKDSQNVVTLYTYDALNRLTSKAYKNTISGSLTSCFRYDAAGSTGVPYATGRLTAEWTQPGSCASTSGIPSSAVSWKKILSYDTAGHVTREQACAVASRSNAPSLLHGFDLAGNVMALTQQCAHRFVRRHPGTVVYLRLDLETTLGEQYEHRISPGPFLIQGRRWKPDDRIRLWVLWPHGGATGEHLGTSAHDDPKQNLRYPGPSNFSYHSRKLGWNSFSGGSGNAPVALTISPLPLPAEYYVDGFRTLRYELRYGNR